VDEIVRTAMEKWPDVPALFGWLSLDPRGRWRLKGELITNPALTDFIARNYAADERGRWFFQNGPQRVYVTLEAAPWIVRWHTNVVTTQSGDTTTVAGFIMNEFGDLYVETPLGLAKVDDRDLASLADSIHATQDGTLEIQHNGQRYPIPQRLNQSLSATYGFISDPENEADSTHPRP